MGQVRVQVIAPLALLLLAAPAFAQDEAPSYQNLLDQAKAAIVAGDFKTARTLLDSAETAAPTNAGLIMENDLARLRYYRGVVEWKDGDKDNAALEAWRQAITLSEKYAPDESIVESEAVDVYYALMGEVKAREGVTLNLPEDPGDAVIFVDGRKMEPFDSVLVGTHFIQMRCGEGNVVGSWYTFGAPPPDYLTLCSGGTYPVTKPTTGKVKPDKGPSKADLAKAEKEAAKKAAAEKAAADKAAKELAAKEAAEKAAADKAAKELAAKEAAEKAAADKAAKDAADKAAADKAAADKAAADKAAADKALADKSAKDAADKAAADKAAADKAAADKAAADKAVADKAAKDAADKAVADKAAADKAAADKAVADKAAKDAADKAAADKAAADKSAKDAADKAAADKSAKDAADKAAADKAVADKAAKDAADKAAKDAADKAAADKAAADKTAKDAADKAAADKAAKDKALADKSTGKSETRVKKDGGGTVGWVMIGTGAAMIGGGGAVNFLVVNPAFAEAEAVNADPLSATRAEADAIVSRFNTGRIATIGLLAAGVATAGVGVFVGPLDAQVFVGPSGLQLVGQW